MRNKYWASAPGWWWTSPNGRESGSYKVFCSKQRAIRCAYKLAEKFGQAEVVKLKKFSDGTRLVQEIHYNHSKVQGEK